MVCDPAKVDNFISKLEKILNKPGSFQLIPRKKNLDAIYKMGLSIDTVKEYIKNLTRENYCEGPKKDENDNFSGKVWIFGKKIDGVIFYIKLKIKKDSLLCCLSFHDAKYNMKFPFR